MPLKEPLTLIKYDLSDPSKLPKKNVWIRVIGEIDKNNILALCQYFDLHELTIGDIMNYAHQSKYETNNLYSQYILKSLNLDSEKELSTSQYSIISGVNYLLTFEQKEISHISVYFDKLLKQKTKPSIKKITFDLLNCIVDGYLDLIPYYQNHFDDIVDEMLNVKYNYELEELFKLKRSMHVYRKAVRPSYEIIQKVCTPSTVSFTMDFSFYVKDLLDHANRSVLFSDSMWESTNNLQTEILTKLQYDLSKTMNVMTSISMIFSPLVLIAGIYGMNFKYIPGIDSKYGYPITLAIMIVIALGLFLYFIKKRFF